MRRTATATTTIVQVIQKGLIELNRSRYRRSAFSQSAPRRQSTASAPDSLSETGRRAEALARCVSRRRTEPV